MKKTSFLSIATIFALIVLPGACRKKETVSNTTPQPTPSRSVTQNSNQPVKPIDQSNANSAKPSGASPTTDNQALLLGEYEMREIQDRGVVTMVSAIKTKIFFMADGSYSRVSKKDGRTYHSDSGRFRVEPPDKLVLSIQLSGQAASQTIQTPAIEKTHKFKLSPDGEELKLTSDKGSVAVYHRLSKPKTK
jgi:hypothetical protein